MGLKYQMKLWTAKMTKKKLNIDQFPKYDIYYYQTIVNIPVLIENIFNQMFNRPAYNIKNGNNVL